MYLAIRNSLLSHTTTAFLIFLEYYTLLCLTLITMMSVYIVSEEEEIVWILLQSDICLCSKRQWTPCSRRKQASCSWHLLLPLPRNIFFFFFSSVCLQLRAVYFWPVSIKVGVVDWVNVYNLLFVFVLRFLWQQMKNGSLCLYDYCRFKRIFFKTSI